MVWKVTIVLWVLFFCSEMAGNRHVITRRQA